MPLCEAEVDELLENLKPDDNDNFTKENIIEVADLKTTSLLFFLLFQAVHTVADFHHTKYDPLHCPCLIQS